MAGGTAAGKTCMKKEWKPKRFFDIIMNHMEPEENGSRRIFD
ncbi:hypothetical protein HMPREF3293_03154 [Christensenella minuta]|uniref:Uncharacterized protein n=1 Tax=Christensenella minuta TaxID=626937 RepID=A0A136Q0Z0_9FIRM|nr:hypothetical protein HMPREF3293_03154 [Christensenella minuta]